MLASLTIDNLFAWTLQAACIAGAAALLIRLMPLRAAGVRYAYWRLALALCFAVPFLGEPAPAAPLTAPPLAVSVIADVTSVPAAPAAAQPVIQSVAWPSMLPWALACGIGARALWIGLGLVRLRRLRSRGEAVEDAEYQEIQDSLGTRASVRAVSDLTQPVTFGIVRPVVLLPATLADAPEATRRAVLTHELFHVRRRDWGWVAIEEAVRTALWFNPAIWWLTSQIQAAREEFVDHLTVLATGSRRSYIEALLTFSAAAPTRPAAAFARRPHLFTRIVRLSQENVMSSSRLVVYGSIVTAVLIATGWYASNAFPLMAAPASMTEMTSPATDAVLWARDSVVVKRQSPPAQARGGAVGAGARGASRPGPAPVPARQPQTTNANPITPENPIPRRTYSVPVLYPAELQGSGISAGVDMRVRVDSTGTVTPLTDRVSSAISTRDGAGQAPGDAATRGRDLMVVFRGAVAESVRQWRYEAPAQPPIEFYVSVIFAPDQNGVVSQSEQSRGVSAGPAGIRLGAASNYEPTRAAAVPVIRDAVSGAASTGVQPVRVGGAIKAPAQTRKVAPVYPAIAQSARVQGVVILEATLDEQGHVADARVLRSIPLLDQAAIDAVKQWEYTPTLLNGVPVSVIMTITVQFTLADGGAVFVQ